MSGLALLKDLMQVPGLLKEIYGDVAKPGCIQVGKALETIFGLGNTILLPLQLANARGREYFVASMERYREKLSKVPVEEIIAPRPEVAVPILEKLTHVADANLVELYVNLLTLASTSQGDGSAHPNLVHVINSLSPPEATILEMLKDRRRFPFLLGRVSKDNRKDKFDFTSPTWYMETDFLVSKELELKIPSSEHIPAFITNLNALGLVQLWRDRTMAEEDIYVQMQLHHKPLMEKHLAILLDSGILSEEDKQKLSIEYEPAICQLSPFGWLFVESCCASS